MATTSFQGIVRSYGGQDKSSGATPSVLLLSEVISFNAAAAAVALTPVRIGTSATTGLTLFYQQALYPFHFQ